jgi:hypothetical protein
MVAPGPRIWQNCQCFKPGTGRGGRLWAPFGQSVNVSRLTPGSALTQTH